MTNQVYEALRTLMAVREYQDKEIPNEALRRIVEAAHNIIGKKKRKPFNEVVSSERFGSPSPDLRN